MAKPTTKLDWVTDNDVTKITEPSVAKKLTGWLKEEKPPFQYFNWGWNLIDRWIKYFEEKTDANTTDIGGEATARQAADNAHAVLTSPHSAASAATAGRLIIRDSNGRAQVAAPSADADIARKAEVDAEATARAAADGAHAALENNPHAVTADQVGAAEAGANTNITSMSGLTTPLSLGQGGSGTNGDSIIKAWINFNGTGTIAINDSFNVSSIIDDGPGDYTIIWDVDFATTNYALVGTCDDGGDYARVFNINSLLTTGALVGTKTGNDSSMDMATVCVIAMGDQ